MWKSIQLADVFISHPVKDFVPAEVNMDAVQRRTGSTNSTKNMQHFDVDCYLHEFNVQCQKESLPELAYPKRAYNFQIARLDPAKGISDIIKSFALFRLKLLEEKDYNTPQLVVCGHSSVDDPDGSMVYGETMKLIHNELIDLKDDIIIIRLGPSDQMLNAIISKVTIVLQLSTCEGFEVKVSEAPHKRKPIIVTHTGGIQFQVSATKNGFLVPPRLPPP